MKTRKSYCEPNISVIQWCVEDSIAAIDAADGLLSFGSLPETEEPEELW